MLAGLGPGTPNAKFSEGLKKEQTTLRGQVFDAWKRRVVKQEGDGKKNMSASLVGRKKWPTLASSDRIERIPEDLRQTYMNAALPNEWKKAVRGSQGSPPEGQRAGQPGRSRRAAANRRIRRHRGLGPGAAR